MIESYCHCVVENVFEFSASENLESEATHENQDWYEADGYQPPCWSWRKDELILSIFKNSLSQLYLIRKMKEGYCFV